MWIITLAATFGIAALGFLQTREFVRKRLTYVDSALTAKAPIIAGVGAAALAVPIFWLLPFVGVGAALAFGVAVAAGVISGQRAIRRRLSGGTDLSA